MCIKVFTLIKDKLNQVESHVVTRTAHLTNNGHDIVQIKFLNQDVLKSL